MKVHARLISRLAAVSVLLLLSMGALAAQTIAPSGLYGFLLNTSFTNPANQGGAAILGVMNFDGAGNVKGTFVLEYGSGGPTPVQTIPGTFTGTYASNPDGTGSITIALSNGISLTLAMVMADSNQGLQLVATSISGGIDLSTSVLSGVGARAVGYTQKGLAILKNSYRGQFAFSPQPSKSLVSANFDGAGNVTWTDTFVGSGPNVASATYTGTYSVQASATGAITLAATTGQSAQTFVYVMTYEGGPGLLLLQINRLGDGVRFGSVRLQ